MAKKWIQGAVKRPGALRRYFKKKKGEKISKTEMARAYKKDGTRLKRMINLARTLGKLRKKK